MNLKRNKYDDVADEYLIPLILDGNNEALNSLILKYKDWIYNIALRMTGYIPDAEDITQEILIKIITKLSTFRFKSSFKTWLYQITINHIFNIKKSLKEKIFTSFDTHRRLLNQLDEIKISEESIDSDLYCEETKIECMMGMLLCLDREQRIIFVLGSIFEIDSVTGCKILDISEVNYRQKLSRARKDMKNYMNEQCSLLNNNCNCKCAKKAKAAIKVGYINPESLKYNSWQIKKVKDMVIKNKSIVDDVLELRCQELFKEHPYLILKNEVFQSIVNVNRLIN